MPDRITTDEGYVGYAASVAAFVLALVFSAVLGGLMAEGAGAVVFGVVLVGWLMALLAVTSVFLMAFAFREATKDEDDEGRGQRLRRTRFFATMTAFIWSAWPFIVLIWVRQFR